MTSLKRLLLGLALVVLAIVLGLVFSLRDAGHAARTPDGHQAVVESVTFGKKHRHLVGKPWFKPLYPFFTTSLPSWFGVSAFEITNTSETLVCWVRVSPPRQKTACLTDTNGFESSPRGPDRMRILAAAMLLFHRSYKLTERSLCTRR